MSSDLYDISDTVIAREGVLITVLDVNWQADERELCEKDWHSKATVWKLGALLRKRPEEAHAREASETRAGWWKRRMKERWGGRAFLRA